MSGGWTENFDQKQNLRIVVVRQDEDGGVFNLPRLVLIAMHRLRKQAQFEAGIVGIPELVRRKATGLLLELAQTNGALSVWGRSASELRGLHLNLLRHPNL